MEKTRWVLRFRRSIQYAEEMVERAHWQGACLLWMMVGLWKGRPEANLDLKSTWRGQVHLWELSGKRGWMGHSQVLPLDLPLEGSAMSYFVSKYKVWLHVDWNTYLLKWSGFSGPKHISLYWNQVTSLDLTRAVLWGWEESAWEQSGGSYVCHEAIGWLSRKWVMEVPSMEHGTQNRNVIDLIMLLKTGPTSLSPPF